MQQVIPDKIISLRNEIYRDVYNKSEWIYVKLQSLFEVIGRLYLDLSLRDGEFAYTNPNGFAIFNYLERRYIKNQKLANQFATLNERANLIKHNTDPNRLQIAKFELPFVTFCFKEYNQYASDLFKKDGIMFWLDLSIISDFTTVKVSPMLAKKQIEVYKPSVKSSTTSNIESSKSFYQTYCGAGKQDYGFQIYGLPAKSNCNLTAANIYATVYGFLQRSLNVQKSCFIKSRENKFGKIFNLSKIFRYQLILLLMIRSNYVFNSTLTVFPIEESDMELSIAADSIMDYASKLSKLSGIEFTPISIIISKNGVKISASDNSSADIRTLDFTSRQLDPTRDIWFERPIKYSIKESSEHQVILETLLNDFFGYTTFKPGQFEALVHMLNCSESSLCIMPTGGGKSLIFYFLSLLQPGPSLIVSPTRVLITDQIRNMQTLHHIDDVQTLSNYDLYNKGHFSINNKFILLTPADFQHYAFIYKVIELNQDRKISGIILDEIHTISNWSHDFRPDYLMLSFNLITFADHPRIYGFTATANYRVVKDIKKQLSVLDESIVLPVELKRTDISFEYMSVPQDNDFATAFKENVRKIAFDSRKGSDKMLTFTKNENQSESLIKSIDEDCLYHIDVFHSNTDDSYIGFVKGRKSVLVADSSMGIGINLPDVYHIMHVGLPISKAQYVQEIGRASRFGHGAKSTVVFKSKKSMTPQERRALDFNTSIDEILSILANLPTDNDIASAFKSILGHIENYAAAANNIYSLYEKLISIDNFTVLNISVDPRDIHQMRRYQVYLYFLHKMGIIYNWYVKQQSGASIEYLIEVEHDKSRLPTVKQKTIDYISQLSDNKKVFYLVEHAADTKEVILIVQQWYYNEFLYFHREQMLNILDFFEINASAKTKDNEIMAQLSEYFAVGISSNGTDNLSFLSSLTIRELFEKSKEIQDSSFISSIEHRLENEYDSKLDLFLFFHQLFCYTHFNQSRLERIVCQISDPLWIDLMDNLFIVYRDCTDDEKLVLFNIITLREEEQHIIERIYEKNTPDIIYYGYFSKTVNQLL